MGRNKQPPEYYEARRALARHFYRHHGRTRGLGTLADRLDIHEELHAVAERQGYTYGHDHEVLREGETDIELALRVLEEGERQHGQTDSAESS